MDFLKHGKSEQDEIVEVRFEAFFDPEPFGFWPKLVTLQAREAAPFEMMLMRQRLRRRPSG